MQSLDKFLKNVRKNYETMSSFKLIPLGGKYGKGKFAKVSNRHYEAVNKITWSLEANNRIRGNVNGVRKFLNVYVWFLEHGVYPDKIVDHITSTDLLNNTIENLRLATGSENRANSTLSSKNRSGCKNVAFSPRRNKWRVTVGTSVIGVFNTIDEAVTTAKKASVEKYTQFSKCETDDVRLDISRKFDIQRNLSAKVNYTKFFTEEMAKVARLPNTEEDCLPFKQVKEQWEIVKDSGLYKQIIMTGGEAKNGEFVIVDAKYYEILSKTCITLQGQSPRKLVNGVSIPLHLHVIRDLMGQSPANDSDTVDHKDRKHWHCVEMNLRYGTGSQQSANQGLKSHNSSGFKGVFSQSNKWLAQIGINGKTCRLGIYTKQKYAIFMYDIAANLHFGEYVAANYHFRNAVTPYDFGEDSITLNDLEEILFTLTRDDIITNRDIYLPSLIPYLRLQIQEMKSKVAPKRSAVDAGLPGINVDE